MDCIYDDGGRAQAGFKGSTGDCATRSIAIVTGLPYKQVYDRINELAGSERTGRRKRGISNARTGVYRQTVDKIMKSLGYIWTPTMLIGQGCKVHLRSEELPSGRLLCVVSKHYTAVIDGVIHDTFNPSREVHSTRPNDGGPLKKGEWLHPDGDVICSIQGRCVYGYYSKPDYDKFTQPLKFTFNK